MRNMNELMRAVRPNHDTPAAGAAARNKIRQKWLMLVVFFVIAVIISFAGVIPASVNLKEGDIAMDNIVAPRRIVDTRMTEALRIQAENMTSPIYDYIASAKTEALGKIGTFFGFIVMLDENAVNDTAVASYNSVYGVSLTPEQYAALAALSTWSTNQLSDNISTFASDAYAGEVVASKLDAVLEGLSAKIDDMPGYSGEVKTIAKLLLRFFIGPNMIINEEATALAKEAARESVHEVVYEAGQTIINMGSVVTAHQIQLLKDCGLIRTSIFENIGRLVGVPGLILVIMGMFITYLYFYHYEIFYDNKRLMLLTTQIVLMLVIAMACSYFSVYLIPISILTMSLCMVFNARVAVQTNLFFMLLLGVTLQLDFDSFVYLTISGYIGIMYTRQINARTQLFKSAALVSVVNLLVILLIAVFRSTLSVRTFSELAYGIGNGLISAFLTNAFLLIWEGLFNVTTPFKLLEMSGASDQVMQRLMMDAPGTYQHSLVVSNMAQAAAKAIGANALLARVGAYYHDIGKAPNAIYFKENQSNDTNPHDFISPVISAKILKDHVNEGVALADKHNLPDEVSEFICTHHGTSEMTYFKVKAEEAGYQGDEDFHYTGRIPITKETSVVMLADSCEAAVRSLDEPTPENITKMIEMIFKKKTAEKQLIKSALSYSETERIKGCFNDVLVGVYHTRIKYPEHQADDND